MRPFAHVKSCAFLKGLECALAYYVLQGADMVFILYEMMATLMLHCAGLLGSSKYMDYFLSFNVP